MVGRGEMSIVEKYTRAANKTEENHSKQSSVER